MGDLLPSGTAVYDLTVEEDHSYVVEGFVAKNTNCKCAWRHEPVYDDNGIQIGWDSYWELGHADHCDDCIDNSKKWAPYHTALAVPELPPLVITESSPGEDDQA